MLKKVYKMSASWCMPCKMYAPTFHKVSENEKYKDVIFEELDADNNEEMFIKYGIRSVPTTVFVDENEKEIAKVSGNLPEKALIEEIDKLME